MLTFYSLITSEEFLDSVGMPFLVLTYVYVLYVRNRKEARIWFYTSKNDPSFDKYYSFPFKSRYRLIYVITGKEYV